MRVRSTLQRRKIKSEWLSLKPSEMFFKKGEVSDQLCWLQLNRGLRCDLDLTI